jgi:AraC-like DNA-binding protein
VDDGLVGGSWGEQRGLRRAGPFVLSETRHARGLRIARHDHERASINLVLTGAYQETCRDVSAAHAPGAVIVKPPGEHHANDFAYGRARCILVEIGEEAFEGLGPLARVFNRPGCTQTLETLPLGRHIARELRDQDDLSDLALVAVLTQLLVDLSREERRVVASSNLVRRIAEAMRQDPARRPSLDKLSSDLGLSAVELARLFKGAMGMSIADYMRRAQLEQALALLSDLRLTLTDVAHAAGFYDHSHMVRRFRRELGTTPSALRRRRG